MSKKKIIVIGNGMVGHKFIQDLLSQPNSENFEITTISEESRLAYDRVHLSSYFDGSTAADLALTTKDEYREQGISFRLNDKVASIDSDKQLITTESGHQLNYDKLVMATGSYPFVPPIPGSTQPHCLTYRTIDDLGEIMGSVKESKIGVVIGGGLLGLEAANALKAAGLKTHVVEFASQLMAVQLDEGVGRLLRRKIEDLGVTVHTEKATSEIVKGESCRYRMNFADGSHLETDMLVFSAGIRPRDDLAKQAELNVGERGGIEIDNFCRTSTEHIYAVGECALWGGRIFGLVAPGYSMAKVAAQHIAGNSKDKFLGADMSTKLKLLGIDVASIGDAHGKTAGSQSYTYSDDIAQVYKRLIISEDGKKVIGAV